jgi:steroid delta-isomerase-like uncharacterized protein
MPAGGEDDAMEARKMDRAEMDRLIEARLSAEQAGDTAGCVAMYTADVEHDVVGAPHGPLRGRQAAQGFYDTLVRDIATEEKVPLRGYYGEDFCVIEHEWTGAVRGAFLGVQGDGRRISFRVLHVWEFRDGLISRENVWLDRDAIVQQLTALAAERAAAAGSL